MYGEIRTPGAEHTIVLYAHYDGQPVTPSEWETAPFTPELRTVNGELRIYARGAGDDKAAIFAQLTALDAMKAAGIGQYPSRAGWPADPSTADSCSSDDLTKAGLRTRFSFGHSGSNGTENSLMSTPAEISA